MPFIQLHNALGGGVAGANVMLTTFRPSQLSEYLDALWSAGRFPNLNPALGIPGGGAVAHQAMARPNAGVIDVPVIAYPIAVPVAWHHAVYAYLLENTRIVDLFRRVIHEWTHGERIANATLPTQRWIQATEQVFFADPWRYSVRATTSSLRSDFEAVRRGLYYRLFGMDLNHAAEDSGSRAGTRANAANRDFAAVFEALLVEVWQASMNVTNTASQNPTDVGAIAVLMQRLSEMLRTRRLNATLSREEFDAVALLSWLHVTVLHDNQVILDLSAAAAGVADRLKNVGERVGLPAHARSDAYFQLAPLMSAVLRDIEANVLVPGDLYLPGGVYQLAMLQVILHWSIATGRDVKDRSSRPSVGAVLAATGSRGSAEGGRVLAFAR